MINRLLVAAALLVSTEVQAAPLEGVVVANCLDATQTAAVGKTRAVAVLPDGRMCVGGNTPYTAGAVPINASSGDVANLPAVATLPGVPDKLTFISGFQCTSDGSTDTLGVSISVSGVIGGSMFYSLNTGNRQVSGQQMIVPYSIPVPASAINTAIIVTMPPNGSGNTHAACSAQGFQLPFP